MPTLFFSGIKCGFSASIEKININLMNVLFALIAVPLPSTMRVLEQSTNFYKMYFNDMPDYDA